MMMMMLLMRRRRGRSPSSWRPRSRRRSASASSPALSDVVVSDVGAGSDGLPPTSRRGHLATRLRRLRRRRFNRRRRKASRRTSICAGATTRIASHHNSDDALESCDTLACVRALRAIATERKTCLVMSCGRSSPGVVGTAQAPHLSSGAVGAATYEASLVREALKDLGPNIEQATFVAEGDNGRSVVPEREGGASQLAIAQHLRSTRVGQLEPKLTAGEQVVTVWPRADRVTRSREHLRALVALFPWARWVVLNPPCAMLREAFGDAVEADDIKFDAERHGAAFARMAGYACVDAAVLAWALWRVIMTRSRHRWYPDYVIGVPVVVTRDNVDAILPQSAELFRRLYTDLMHWPVLDVSKLREPGPQTVPQAVAAFLGRLVVALSAPPREAREARRFLTMFPRDQHGQFNFPAKCKNNPLFTRCPCSFDRCIEDCPCSCNACTARAPCEWADAACA